MTVGMRVYMPKLSSQARNYYTIQKLNPVNVVLVADTGYTTRATRTYIQWNMRCAVCENAVNRCSCKEPAR